MAESDRQVGNQTEVVNDYDGLKKAAFGDAEVARNTLNAALATGEPLKLPGVSDEYSAIIEAGITKHIPLSIFSEGSRQVSSSSFLSTGMDTRGRGTNGLGMEKSYAEAFAESRPKNKRKAAREAAKNPFSSTATSSGGTGKAAHVKSDIFGNSTPKAKAPYISMEQFENNLSFYAPPIAKDTDNIYYASTHKMDVEIVNGATEKGWEGYKGELKNLQTDAVIAVVDKKPSDIQEAIIKQVVAPEIAQEELMRMRPSERERERQRREEEEAREQAAQLATQAKPEEKSFQTFPKAMPAFLKPTWMEPVPLRDTSDHATA